MSQHLDYPLPLRPAWAHLPHDPLPQRAAHRGRPPAPPRPRASAAAAALMAVPMAVATIAGVALAVAPLA